MRIWIVFSVVKAMVTDKRKKFIKIFIITLIILQGLYVIIPLPDIWPIANYSMFSKSEVKTVASRLEVRGVKEDGNEVSLNISKHFSPMDRIRLSRGISRILDSEKYREKNEKRINLFAKYMDFLPIDGNKLKEMIRNNIVYESNFENKEDALNELFDFLLLQYEYNGEKSSTSDVYYEKIDELKLYRVYWNWTNTAPSEVIAEEKLLYSTKTGLFYNE